MNESKNVLIVDDEVALSEIIAYYVEEAGYKSFTADNVDKALELIKHNKFDCILSDVRMPEKDGKEFFVELKKNNSKIPFIFITGFSDYSELELIDMGATAVLGKPVDEEELMRIIKKHVF